MQPLQSRWMLHAGLEGAAPPFPRAQPRCGHREPWLALCWRLAWEGAAELLLALRDQIPEDASECQNSPWKQKPCPSALQSPRRATYGALGKELLSHIPSPVSGAVLSHLR